MVKYRYVNPNAPKGFTPEQRKTFHLLLEHDLRENVVDGVIKPGATLLSTQYCVDIMVGIALLREM